VLFKRDQITIKLCWSCVQLYLRY